MSTKELIEEANKLLESSWEEHEKVLVKRMLDTMVSYKSLIPKSLKSDIKAMLVMANRIKNDYDELVIKYKSKASKDISTATLNEEEILEEKSVIKSLETEQLEIEKLKDELEDKLNDDLEKLNL